MIGLHWSRMLHVPSPNWHLFTYLNITRIDISKMLCALFYVTCQLSELTRTVPVLPKQQK